MSDHYVRYCGACGRQMLPLFNQLYCPNECDRKPKVDVETKREDPPRTLWGVIPSWDDGD